MNGGTLLPIRLTVNGVARALDVAPRETLLRVLRDRFGLTGVKESCGEGECGVCTVLLDGRTVNACLVLAVEADGCEIVTVEGIAGADGLHPVQEAFLESGAVQCGFCTPGMVLSSVHLLRKNARPTPAEVREALCGNLCRCTGYGRIVSAVSAAAERMRAGASGPAAEGPPRPAGAGENIEPTGGEQCAE